LLALLLVAPWLCAAAEFKFFEPVKPPRPFQVMAHHGERRQSPDNSRPALRRCIEDYVEWAEVDVRLTKDGQHILSHDASVTNAAGRWWVIRQSDWPEVDLPHPESKPVARQQTKATSFTAPTPLLACSSCPVHQRQAVHNSIRFMPSNHLPDNTLSGSGRECGLIRGWLARQNGKLSFTFTSVWSKSRRC
jgi:hypothetical protein